MRGLIPPPTQDSFPPLLKIQHGNTWTVTATCMKPNYLIFPQQRWSRWHLTSGNYLLPIVKYSLSQRYILICNWFLPFTSICRSEAVAHLVITQVLHGIWADPGSCLFGKTTCTMAINGRTENDRSQPFLHLNYNWTWAWKCTSSWKWVRFLSSIIFVRSGIWADRSCFQNIKKV
jgi:hypothetical protein